MAEKRNVYRFLVGKPERKKNHLVEIGVDGIILKITFDRYGAMARTELVWLTTQMVGSCDNGNEPPHSLKDGQFLD